MKTTPIKRAPRVKIIHHPDTALWQADSDAFTKWFAKQQYSFGAIPSWTQVEEMRRVWCIARKTARKGQS